MSATIFRRLRRDKIAAIGTLAILLLSVSAGAFSRSFCDDLISAVNEGTKGFSEIRGNRTDNQDFPEYQTAFRFSSLPVDDDGCSLIGYDDDRPSVLSLNCQTADQWSESDARPVYEQIKGALGDCVRSHYQNATVQVDSKQYDGSDTTEGLSILNLATTNDGWHLTATLTFYSRLRRHHGQRVPSYFTNLTLGRK